MPVTSEQKKSVVDNLFSWDDLEKETQNKIFNRKRASLLSFFSEVDSSSLPEEYVELAEKAWIEMDRLNTPWFFVECFLDQIMPDETSVKEKIDADILEECSNDVYLSRSGLDFGMEIV